MTFEQDFQSAIALLDEERFVDAIAAADELILERPGSADAVILAAIGCYKLGRSGLAAMLYETALKRAPDRAHVYSNLACCLVERHPEEALRALEEGLKYDDKSPVLMANMCSAHQALGNYAESLAWATKCLEIDPGNPDATYNSSLALLGLGAWHKAWPRYDVSLGNRHRKELFFNENEQRWTPEAENVRCLVVYPEQGLGDEILFASMFDHLKNVKADEIIIQCDPRLEGLFTRSFPWAQVSGTRDQEPQDWFERVTHKIEMGGLGNFYAREAFRRGAYLVPDMPRRIMWRALFRAMEPKPKIGLAWTGGNKDTGMRKRSLPLETLRPLIEATNAHFFSLEYKGEEGMPEVIDLRYGTRTKDYDDTAAMVSELDLVISVTTTVVDLCGALGKECWALAPAIPPWRYGFEGEQMHFYESVRVFRQCIGEPWDAVVRRVTEALQERIANDDQQLRRA